MPSPSASSTTRASSVAVGAGVASEALAVGSALAEGGGLADGAALAVSVLDGWRDDISAVREFAALPKAAQVYVDALEDLSGVPIRYVSVGPAREQTLERT